MTLGNTTWLIPTSSFSIALHFSWISCLKICSTTKKWWNVKSIHVNHKHNCSNWAYILYANFLFSPKQKCFPLCIEMRIDSPIPINFSDTKNCKGTTKHQHRSAQAYLFKHVLLLLPTSNWCILWGGSCDGVQPGGGTSLFFAQQMLLLRLSVHTRILFFFKCNTIFYSSVVSQSSTTDAFFQQQKVEGNGKAVETNIGLVKLAEIRRITPAANAYHERDIMMMLLTD